MDHITANGPKAPEGGLALPMRYTVMEVLPCIPSCPPMPFGKTKLAKKLAAKLAKDERDNARRSLYFPQVCRRSSDITVPPGLHPIAPSVWISWGLPWPPAIASAATYDAAEVRTVFYPEMEKLLLAFYPEATDALVYNHDVFDKDYDGDRTEDQDAKNPGVNANYANLVHNDLNDNSGRVRCRNCSTRKSKLWS